MEKLKAKITENREIAKNYYKMVLDTGYGRAMSDGTSSPEAVGPGQFVNLELPDLYLRRPISICDFENADLTGGKGEKPEKSAESKGRAESNGLLTLIYKTVGKGTEEMAGLNVGQELDLLMPLVHGFNVEKAGEHPVLIGGGAGAAPLYFLAKEIIRTNPKAKVTVLLGFNTKDEVLLEKEFKELPCELRLFTVDGTYAEKGFAPDGLAALAQGGHGYTYFYACGPMPMFRAIEAKAKGDGEYSFEERMGCGFGACMGCSHKTKNGYKRICKDGPVLSRGEILWD